MWNCEMMVCAFERIHPRRAPARTISIIICLLRLVNPFLLLPDKVVNYTQNLATMFMNMTTVFLSNRRIIGLADDFDLLVV
jgi:hypothetical protein